MLVGFARKLALEGLTPPTRDQGSFQPLARLLAGPSRGGAGALHRPRRLQPRLCLQGRRKPRPSDTTRWSMWTMQTRRARCRSQRTHAPPRSAPLQPLPLPLKGPPCKVITFPPSI